MGWLRIGCVNSVTADDKRFQLVNLCLWWLLLCVPGQHPTPHTSPTHSGGAYDLEGLAEHLHRRGLYKNLLDSIMSLDGKVRCKCSCVPCVCVWLRGAAGGTGSCL